MSLMSSTVHTLDLNLRFRDCSRKVAHDLGDQTPTQTKVTVANPNYCTPRL